MSSYRGSRSIMDVMIRRLPKAIILFFFVSGILFPAYAEVFVFRHQKGDKYRAVTEVRQQVTLGSKFGEQVFPAEVLNKIAFSVEEVEGNKALISGEFVVSERNAATEGVYAVTHEYPSRYWLYSNGKLEIAPEFMMPVVRNVPVFPDRDLKPGDTWVYKGEEVHDFRDSEFPLSVARFPVTAAYEYTGTEVFEGAEYHIITVEYTVYVQLANDRAPGYTRLSARSFQKLYWNKAAGRHYRSEDDFRFRWDLYSGEWVVFEGTAVGRIIDAELMDKARMAEDIRETLKDVADTDVRVDDEGVTISLQNIQFTADSAVLLESEKQKIRRIAQILSRYPQRDILVSGHTALAGTPEGRLQLSLDRSRAVADYLVRLGARTNTQIMIRGYGATRPIDTNTTEEGMRANRRVEITIMEN
ncbi:MAG: OmpA family protein [Spirochaetales bacterium]|nr:OmpA family protein [Spirochaetales bacterium]